MMSHDAQVNTCYHVNCQRRTRAHDAAQHRRKPFTGSPSSCRPHHKAPFRSKLETAYDRRGFFLYKTGNHLHLAALVYFFTIFTKFFFSPSFSSFGYPTRHESSPQKLSHNVVQCRAKSRDAQGNMCYNVNCQRKTKEHTLPSANAPKSCHRMSPKVVRQTSQYVL